MISRAKRLRVPAQLRAVMMGSVAAFACSSTTTTAPPKDGGPLSDGGPSADGGRDASRDGSRDASFDGGPCKIDVPAGTACETTCYNIGTDPISPYACQVYCSPPDGGPGSCSCNGGFEPEGGAGFCPGLLNCELDAYPDGGTQVLC